MRTQFFVRSGLVVAVGVVYFLGGKLGVQLAFAPTIVSPMWPPTGIALAAVLLLGYWIWPSIFIGAFFFDYMETHSVFLSLGVASANVIEACVAAYLVEHFVGLRNPLNRAKDLFKYVVFGAGLSTILCATIGTLAVCINDPTLWGNYRFLWFTWWLGDAVGILVVAPLLLAWGNYFPRQWNLAHLGEGMGLLLLVTIVSQVVFGGLLPTRLVQPLPYLCMPLLLWAAFRFGQKGVSVAVALLTILAIRGTTHGFGPFTGANQTEALVMLQVFIGIISITSLAIAAIISERKEAQNKLARSNAELERFAYLLSHDLQEPLRTVSSYCALIRKKLNGQLDPDMDQYISFAVDAAKRMYALINAVLEFSRLGKKLRLKPISATVIVDEALANLQAGITEVQAKISKSTLPVVFSDPELLVLVFQNLIGNAIKFRKDIPPSISISAKAIGEYWVFAVEDNGIGIEQEYFDKIFKPFQRLHQANEYPGTGIGLAACKKIVEEHGGKIWVDSSIGMGSSFYFSLPVVRNHIAA